ncbi:MAG: HNH endonuclease, partial [Chryseobacterium sp.]
MAERKDIGKKTRFEVFKRDKFTCQYCGNKAPDVILNVDHMHPVVDGGDNSIINLITSCFGCNSGKGGRKIPDQSILALHREDLEKQQERLEQIEMMAQWRAFLQENNKKGSESIYIFVNEKIKPFSLTDSDKKIIEKLVKKYGLDKVFEATDISADQYLEITSDETKLSASIDKFIKMIEGILICNALPPIDQKIRHIKNIINKKYSKLGYVNPEDTVGIMNRYVTLLK